MNVEVVRPGAFEPSRHFYPRVRNAVVHSLARFFLTLGNARIADRYCHLHPRVDPDAVRSVLASSPKHFRWGGADLFHATSEAGHRCMIVLETNSCPSGQKSMPLLDDDEDQGGYGRLIERSFLPLLRRKLPSGGLAVLFDKNEMEASGYAAAIADRTLEDVFLVPWVDGARDAPARFTDDGVLEVRVAGRWEVIRAAFRYVTQRPWNRIPPVTRTLLYNPVLTCLAGGRNKLLAAKAYDLWNAEVGHTGLAVRTPHTIWDVKREEIPKWVARFGGFAVVKVPYANAGQGVHPVTSPAELEAVMALRPTYDRFIVQGLVGDHAWSSKTSAGRLFHVGTVPDRAGGIYVADLRVMVGATPDGFEPIALYGRRARRPIDAARSPGETSWDVLGTNLSVQGADGVWQTETDRLLLVDGRDFHHLGLGFDEFVEGYLQTVLAMLAIDRMAEQLLTRKGRFRRELFRSLTPDDRLLAEIVTAGSEAAEPVPAATS